MVAKASWCLGQRLWLSNLISFRGAWAFILAVACLCAGWRGAVNPHRLIYAIWKESPGPPVSADSSLLPLSLPREWGLLWSSHTSRALTSWPALLMHRIPALSRGPWGCEGLFGVLCPSARALVSIPGKQSCEWESRRG